MIQNLCAFFVFVTSNRNIPDMPQDNPSSVWNRAARLADIILRCGTFDVIALGDITTLAREECYRCDDSRDRALKTSAEGIEYL
jgi:hypothetical protein